jgi:hypothetical protein
MVQLTNRGRMLELRQARLIVPMALGLLALVGVTARPSLEAQAARSELEAAKTRLGEREREAALLRSLRETASLERAQAGLAGLRELLPASVPDVLAHGALRESARLAGVELTGLRIGETLAGGLSADQDRVRALAATLAGRARLSQIAALLEQLKAFGLPAAVLEFSVSREVALHDVFEFELDLGLFFRSSLGEAADPESDWGTLRAEDPK